MGGDRADFFKGRVTPVNSIIVLINVAVFIWMALMGDLSSTGYLLKHGVDYWPAVFYEHEYYRLLTCTFIHFNIAHVFNNMIILLFIGDNMERALGPVKYLIFYLLTAVGSSFFSSAWHMHVGSMAISAGASGAVFGVVGGILLVLLRNRGHLEDLNTSRIAVFAAYSMLYGIRSSGVDNAAHLAGFALGFILSLILYRKR